MEFILIIVAVLIALALLRVLGFLSPLLLIAAVVGYAINNGWSIPEIISTAVIVIAFSIYGYLAFKKKQEEKQHEDMVEYAKSEKERLDKIWNNRS
ncbi:hypothetical protein [Vibrio sp. 10N.261.46.A3]|uniref:hypothetical protein n=1 Tax=Vibrio sp. 10N.261.46.A3 TaxID=3229658 RepID=UPI00355088FA